MYGWYSLKAYSLGNDEYVYLNHDGQETYCTIVSDTNMCPYPRNTTLYADAVFMGEIKYYVRKIISEKKR